MDTLATRIGALVEGGVEQRVFPGAVWAVGGPDGVLEQGAAGLLDPEDAGRPMAADALFDLASLTKIIAVWAGVGMLWENAQIDLDDPLAKHLPDAAGFPLGAVTLRQFLTHTSGVPLRAALRASYGTDPEAVRLGVLREAMRRPAGEAVEYTDRSALILGFLIEQLADRRLDEVARDAVWSPLGMTATRYGPVPTELVERTAPTEFDDEAGAHVRGSVHDFSGRLLGVCGISGTFSNAPDLGRFLQYLANPEATVGAGTVGFGRRWIRESLRAAHRRPGPRPRPVLGALTEDDGRRGRRLAALRLHRHRHLGVADAPALGSAADEQGVLQPRSRADGAGTE